MFYDGRKMKDYGFSCIPDLLTKKKTKKNGWVRKKSARSTLREKFTKISHGERKKNSATLRRAMKILNRIRSKLFYTSMSCV